MDPVMLSESFLKKVYEPKESAELDVVAVHGLNPRSNPDHWKDTWTKDNCNWIKTLLPDVLPKARIFMYKYQSDAFYRKDSFTVQAIDFLETLQRVRRYAPQRPILFIAHSMGGLLVKTALIWAKSDNGNYSDLANCSKGLATFGTPHRGSDGATLAVIITNILYFLFQSEAKNIELLQHEGEFLDHISNSFLREYKETILISSFYEKKNVAIFFKVVPKESATLSNGHHERRIGVNANHSNMIRFRNRNHPRGRLILREINLLAEKLLKIEASRNSNSKEQKDTKDTKEPEDANHKSAKRRQWEEISVRSEGGFGEDESLSDSDQTPEPEAAPSPTARQTPTFNFDSAPKAATGSSSWEPASAYYDWTCQADRPGQMCPAHCMNCREERKTRNGSLTLDTPPVSSSRLLLSWKPSDLCRKHRLEWTRLSGQQWPTNPFFGFKPQYPMPPPPVAMMYLQKRAEEDRKKKLEQQNQWTKHDSKWAHKPALVNQPPSSRLQVPGSKFNTTYNPTHFDDVLSFSYEAPAIAPSYRSSRPSSPLQRPRTAVPSIRRIPSWESIASTSSSVTAASRSTLLSHTGSSYYRVSSALGSTTATLRPGPVPAGTSHNYTHEHEEGPVRGKGRGGYLPRR